MRPSFPPVILQRLPVGLLILGLAACSPTPVVTAPAPTSSSTTNAPVQTYADTTGTSQINVSSFTGRIVFTAAPHPEQDIYMINADGSGLTQLTTDPAADHDPSWSPDGTHIAFRSRRDGNGEIYVMNADGSGQTNFTNDPAMDLSPPGHPTALELRLPRNGRRAAGLHFGP